MATNLLPQSEKRVPPDDEQNTHLIASGNGGASQSREKPRRRNRVIHSCLECRRRKMKCDRGEPCQNCRTSSQQCVYVTSANDDDHFRRKLAQMKDAKDALDGDLLKNAGDENLRPENRQQPRKRSRPPAESPHEHSDDPEDDGYLEPTPLAVQDAAYADDATDEVDDLGIRIGRLRLGGRIGGLYRPRIADEVLSSLQHSPRGVSPFTGVPTSFSESPKRGSDFTDPSISIFMNPASSHGSLTDFIPPRHVADKLLEQYWYAVHPVARILHRPTFAQRYETLWELIDNRNELPPSLAAIVLSILFSSVISMSEAKVLDRYCTTREELKTRLQMGLEVALNKAQLLKSTKVETLQAFVAYLVSICLHDISRAHSVLTGMAIRLAECMGLHRDPLEYGFPSAECQIRRLIWYQICHLDMKTSQVQGPRPFIHRDGYTTQLPLELPSRSYPSSAPAWNDMLFSIIWFECQEMHRHSLSLRNRIDQKRISLTKAISKIDSFRLEMDAKYGPFLNVPSPTPIQRMAGLVMRMMTSLMYLIPLHRYMNSVTYRVPDRLRQIVLMKGTEALEAAVELETVGDLQPWSWYTASYQQYHTAFLLLVEVFTFPMRKEGSRIWRCLDFIFAEPLTDIPSLSTPSGPAPTPQELMAHRDIKGRYLLTLIAERMQEYQQAKGLKSPAGFKDSMIVNTPQKAGDDTDPTMPLNYAHGEPGYAHALGARANLATQVILPDLHPHPGDGQRRPFNISEGTGSTWSPGFGDFPSTLPDGMASIDGIYPSYLQEPTIGTNSPSSGPHSHGYHEEETIDPQMLDIDWTLWDTIFPPDINDGDLDVPDTSGIYGQ